MSRVWATQMSDLISGENSAESLLNKIKLQKEKSKPIKKNRKKKITKKKTKQGEVIFNLNDLEQLLENYPQGLSAHDVFKYVQKEHSIVDVFDELNRLVAKSSVKEITIAGIVKYKV